MEVMTIGSEPKNSHSFHGDTPWTANGCNKKTGFDCNVGKSARIMRHKLKTIEKPPFV